MSTRITLSPIQQQHGRPQERQNNANNNKIINTSITAHYVVEWSSPLLLDMFRVRDRVKGYMVRVRVVRVNSVLHSFRR